MKKADIEVFLIDCCGDDLTTVNSAKVSFKKQSEYEVNPENENDWSNLSDRDKKLINYLAKHKHFSPFNHAFLTFHVKAPIFVARQLVKHKFMPWNEVSRRYVDEEPEFYFPEFWRAKAANVKQGSSQESMGDEFQTLFATGAVGAALAAYNKLLGEGVCPEQARMILPQNTMTEWYWSGTLGAFCDMLVLRTDEHTQYETRIVANKVLEIVKDLFPVSVKARMENK